CNLGSINLTRMLRRENGNVAIDYNRMAGTVKTAVRFLDNVIDVNRFPLPEIEEMTRKTRKIGLGVMGFADMLIQLGIPYDSEEALGIAAEVMQFISEQACQVSSALAEERGVFPAFSGSIHDVAGGPRLRNASCTTIAPTGTLSMIAGCSCSIEPNFALSFVRHITDGEPLLEINPYFEKIARQEGFYSEELIKKLVSGIRLSDLADVPRPMRQLLVTAHDIDTRWHIRMQAAFQRHTDNAVSKTVNLPHAATREDVAKVYRMAYEEGLKGITVYRDGSRRQQPLCTGQVGLDLIDQRFAAEAASCR
ncbi:MAG: ribonucleoside-diphosphate reductase, adenosylcobalamin-dependent, partial [Dehalococcoidales bacterium]|nr:ribonucleoside-diphosphate reductase, adenosylcobalamin-dependent [Dehalococcoidales bacterium]